LSPKKTEGKNRIEMQVEPEDRFQLNLIIADIHLGGSLADAEY
jgi:hypothetical protein